MPVEPSEEQESYIGSLLTCCGVILRSCLFCCCPASPSRPADFRRGDSYASLLEARGQRLLSAQQESAIEATNTSPPRLPVNERTALLKGHPASSSGGDEQPGHRRTPSDGLRPSSKGSGSAGSEGSSPKAGKHKKSESKLSLLEDDDICPTCLEGYSEENPKVLTRCNHHFHLHCIFEWMERSQTCPVCSRKMEFEELV